MTGGLDWQEGGGGIPAGMGTTSPSSLPPKISKSGLDIVKSLFKSHRIIIISESFPETYIEKNSKSDPFEGDCVLCMGSC